MATVAPSDTRSSADGNLAVPPTTFLGRERDLAEARRLLRDTRLLTATGPGGVGKTRFALELARQERQEWPRDVEDGVFASFLAPLRDPSLVLATIAETLSVREQPGESALEALSSRLEDNRTLLVLDNVEHVLACADELSRLVEECPGLTLVLTSREPLRAPYETVYELPPLGAEEGVALFCERAGAEPTETVRALCARLDGLPLAIELAAARTRLLAPEELLERLSQRLDVLKTGRAADPRQQTLEATIRWSYDLLTEAEQRLFAHLAVFAGGCALEAAVEVCGVAQDGLESLVDKSLLRRSETELGPRFGMLETIREFAYGALEAPGELEEALARYSAHYLRLAERLDPIRYGANTAEDRMCFEAERPNFRAVLGHAIDDGDATTALRLVRHLGDYWYQASGLKESYRAARSALALPGEEPSARAHALYRTGRLAFELGEEAEFRSLYEEAEAAFSEQKDDRWLWQVLQERSFYEDVAGNHAEAVRYAEYAVDLAREMGRRDLEMLATSVLAEALVELELAHAVPDPAELRRCCELHESTVAWARSEAGATEELIIVINHGWLLFLAGEPVDALGRIQEALRIGVREKLSMQVLKDGVLMAGCVAARLGAHWTSAQLVGFAMREFEREGQQPHRNELRYLDEAEAASRAALGDDEYERAVREGAELTADEAISIALTLAADGAPTPAEPRNAL